MSHQLYTEVSCKRNYPSGTFELGLVEDSLVLSEEDHAMTLSALLQERGGSSLIKMVLTRAVAFQDAMHDGIFSPSDDDTEDATPYAPTHDWLSQAATARGVAAGARACSVGPSNGNSIISSSSSRSARAKFVGLSNQGATCYMNSLLQSLFMTPEFREGVYKIPVETDKKMQEDSICFQLQCLFAAMQLSTKPSLETKDLTKSFGWSGAEAFQQHDVQELCRVLFDELESRLKGSTKETLIKDLFEGCMESYVRNMPGGALEFESKKSEAFMDLSLSIREFGNPRPISSIEEGLANFIKPETLDGNNQVSIQTPCA